MQDRVGIHELDAGSLCQIDGLPQLTPVEGDGLLAEDVLTCGQGLTQEVNVGVVWRREPDGVDVGTANELIDGLVAPLDTMLVRKVVRLRGGPVCDAVESTSLKGECLGHLVCYDTATDDAPAQVGGMP